MLDAVFLAPRLEGVASKLSARVGYQSAAIDAAKTANAPKKAPSPKFGPEVTDEEVAAAIKSVPTHYAPHNLSAQHIRNGEVINDFPAVKSGGTKGRKNQAEALETHTERKVLNDLKGKTTPGDEIHMQGELDPCRPGCQPAIREFVAENNVKVIYTTTEGKIWTFRKAEGLGKLKGEVIQEVTENGKVVESYRYWRDEGGFWQRAEWPK
jgi:hypothetical protein